MKNYLNCLKNNLFNITILFLFIFSVTANAAGRHNRIGGNGGQSQNIYCPNNQFAVGWTVYHDNNVIIKIKLHCRRVNANTGRATGNVSFSPWSRSSRPGGTSGLRKNWSNCPNGQFLSDALSGHTGKALAVYTVVSGIKTNCVSYSNINTAAGTSRKQTGPEREIGPRLSGRRELSSDLKMTLINDKALAGLWVHSGYALDSIWSKARQMPWVRQSSRNSSAPNRYQQNSPAVSTTPTATPRPDLYATLRNGSAVWRYSGEYRHPLNGVRYREVAPSFCHGGMQSSSRPDGSITYSKTFNLPSIHYQITNSGGRTNTGSRATEQFTNTQTIDVPILNSGQRFNRTIRRTRQIQRCVINGTHYGPGCYECPRSTRYEDPRLIIRVDSTNVMNETDENNNELRR